MPAPCGKNVCPCGCSNGWVDLRGFANTPEEAAEVAASGKISFEPCHHHAAVGPMAGVVTASMPVWIVENKAYGNKAYCTINEGLGKVLRWAHMTTQSSNICAGWKSPSIPS